MMYVKLILKNLRRSIKEYAIYMATLSISIMLIFAYNGMAFSPQIAILSERLDTFRGIIIVTSVVIALIVAWLIYYISNFILQKRSKEFGMYLLMGMTSRQVSLMFLAEQFVLALLAFGIGCVLGTFAIQIMVMIVLGMFNQPYALSIEVSIQGVLITAIIFFVILLIESLREYRALMKYKIYDLLYCEKKNEPIKKNKKRSLCYSILAILLFIIGCMKLDTSLNALSKSGSDTDLFSSIFLIISSIYLLFHGLSLLLITCINRVKKIKYHGNVMYIYAHIAGKLRSDCTILATLSTLTLATLLCVCVGFKFGEVQSVGIERYFAYDISAVGGEQLDTSAITSYLKAEGVTYQEHTSTTYEMRNDEVPLFKEIGNEIGYLGSENGSYISLSDYNTIRSLNGKEKIAMKDTEYILLVDQRYREQIEQNVKIQQLSLQGQALDFHSMETEYVEGENINVVIPDAFLAYGNLAYKSYYVNTDTPSTREWSKAIESTFYKDNLDDDNRSYVRVQIDWVEENTFSTMIINFCLLYFAIIFTCVCATILATQQLSDSTKQRYTYTTMWRMGLSKKELYALMRKQIALYFFLPIVVSILYALPLLYSINTIFQQTIAQNSMYPYFFASLLFYLIIDLGYYLLAYYGCKQNIKEIL